VSLDDSRSEMRVGDSNETVAEVSDKEGAPQGSWHSLLEV
jgi:hypothetical protein